MVKQYQLISQELEQKSDILKQYLQFELQQKEQQAQYQQQGQQIPEEFTKQMGVV